MTPLYEDIDTLIAKYLAGETTEAENKSLEEWSDQNEENRRYFGQILQIWKESTDAAARSNLNFDTESALLNVKSRIEAQSKSRSAWRIFRQASIAAAVAVMLIALWKNYDSPAETTLAAAADQIATETLADGSVVTMNRGAAITVKKGFNNRERRVFLQGEAFFEVASNPEKKFVVELNDIQISVLGTAFNVDNQTNPKQVWIEVSHGKVAVTAAGQTLILQADQQAIFDRESKLLSLVASTQQRQNIAAYKDKILNFHATPLKDVVADIQKSYGLKVALSHEDLGQCKLTASYNNLPIERLLNIIAESFSLQLTRLPDGTYLYSGTGCE